MGDFWDIKPYHVGQSNIAEILSEESILQSTESGTDLLGNVYYQGFDKIIVHTKNISPDFFDLKTGLAGDILQKFSNYRVKLAIVGNFQNPESNSLRQFIGESNRTGQVYFVSSVDEALALLGR